MPALALADHCQTAADVIAANRAAKERRRNWMSPPKPKLVPEADPEPEPTEPPEAQAPETAVPPEIPAEPGQTEAASFTSLAGSVESHFGWGTAADDDEPLQPMTITAIINAVCEVTGLSRIDIRAARRDAPVVIPRQIAMTLCKRLTLRSLPEVGRMLGGRDHTTVIHGARKYAAVFDQIKDTMPAKANAHQWAAAMWAAVQALTREERRNLPTAIAYRARLARRRADTVEAA